MSVYYNDADVAICAWLRELIRAKLLPDGDVDHRSILEVEPADLRGYTQCHFFAGIGGWPYALRLAGVPTDRSIWTGSPPCQPFSRAGGLKGRADDRHLAPAFLQLVGACRPGLVFGEQVASETVLGRADGPDRAAVDGNPEWAWFDTLASALEGSHYAVAAADLPAACVGAPHIRQRLFFGAAALDLSEGGGLGDAFGARSQGRHVPIDHANQRTARAPGVAGRPFSGDFWGDADWLCCRDGCRRPIEPGTFPLVDGVSSRVGLLRGYGNAIVPQIAAEFVIAFWEAAAGLTQQQLVRHCDCQQRAPQTETDQ